LETMQMVLDLVLKKLGTLWTSSIEITCPDSKVRIRHLALVAWLRDYPEYMKLFTTSYISYPICISSQDQMDAHSCLPVAHCLVDSEELHEKVKLYAGVEATKRQLKWTSREYEITNIRE